MFILSPKGQVSPLLAIEPTIIDVLIRLACIRACVNPTQAISLINAMITDTPVQQDLIKFKRSIRVAGDNEHLGKVGPGYWRGFKARNGNKIVSKKGKKYGLDRSAWSTYNNFNQMYNGVITEFVDAKVAVERDSPAWMDRTGNVVEESEAFGCKVTHDIIHPEYVLVMDEVGGNTSQKGDGHVGGELMVCEAGKTPQRKINTRSKHYTLLPITALNGEPVMCVIIFTGKKENALCETGLDLSAEFIGDPDDVDFFEKNSGEGRAFTGGPKCHFRGKDIACLCRWTENGSVTAEILRDILATIDALEIYDRTIAMPCVLLDGHGSRFGLPFLQYISDPEHEWCVVIGVPYGTAL